MRSCVVFSIVTTFAATAAAQSAPPPMAGRSMRVGEVVDLALRGNVEVRTSAEEIAESEARRKGARGSIGPRLRVDAYAREWNSAFVAGLSGAPGQPTPGFQVRDQFEWNATVTLSQPLTGLFSIFDAYKIQTLGVDIAKVRREATRRETALRVLESYYRLVQARKLVEVAQASVDQLQAQLQRSHSFHTNGVVSQDDVLRAQLAVANAQQRLIQARSRVSFEEARLGVVAGSPELVVEPQPLAAEPESDAELATMDQADRAAQAGRIELAEIDKRIEQSSSAVAVAKLRLVPQVNAEAAYIHNEGSQFQQTNSGYVGARASWEVWDWGTNYSGIGEARARAAQAHLARTRIADQIRLEVHRAFLDLTSATEAMTVARASVASAEENFRLVKVRYENSAATSFDVVDAEGLLTQARGQYQTALYDRVIARAALRRAAGASVEKIARE